MRLRVLAKAGVAMFFFWHAGVIAIGTIPQHDAGAVSTALLTHAVPVVQPYLLLTSQWQNWDLFSPDPMRRMSRYRIEARVKGEPQWRILKTIEPASDRLWRSDEFAFWQRLEDGGPGTEELWRRTAQSLCEPLGLSDDSLIAIVVEYTILPDKPVRGNWGLWRTMTKGSWQSWTPVVTPCPARGDPGILPMVDP